MSVSYLRAATHVTLREDRIDETGERRWHALGLAAGLEPIRLVVHVYREASDGEEIVRIISDRRDRKSERRARERLARLAKKPDSAIDVSAIPPLTDEQLAQMVPYRLRSKTVAYFVSRPERCPHVAEIEGAGSFEPDQCDSRQRDGRRAATEERLSVLEGCALRS